MGRRYQNSDVRLAMNRKEITKFLTDLLIQDRLSDRKYYAREVTLDYGSSHESRVDIMQFVPRGVTYTSDIEAGKFICYEVKSCKEDVYSGNGLNFVGDENYIVTTMNCYKSLQPDIQSGKLYDHIRDMNGGKLNFDFLIAVPDIYPRFNPQKALLDEYDNPTPLEADKHWRYAKMEGVKSGYNKNSTGRTRSMVELLFCMLRSKHSYTNTRRGNNNADITNQETVF